jgi:hypothetical protein
MVSPVFFMAFTAALGENLFSALLSFSPTLWNFLLKKPNFFLGVTVIKMLNL